MYKNILLPLDLGHESSWRKALPNAIDIARQFGARIHLMTVIPEIDIGLTAIHFPKNYGERAQREAKQHLESFIEQHIPDDISVQPLVRHGAIYKEILQAARDLGADVIIMASHRPEMRDYLLGPNAARVVRHAECSVLVVRES